MSVSSGGSLISRHICFCLLIKRDRFLLERGEQGRIRLRGGGLVKEGKRANSRGVEEECRREGGASKGGRRKERGRSKRGSRRQCSCSP